MERAGRQSSEPAGKQASEQQAGKLDVRWESMKMSLPRGHTTSEKVACSTLSTSSRATIHQAARNGARRNGRQARVQLREQRAAADCGLVFGCLRWSICESGGHFCTSAPALPAAFAAASLCAAPRAATDLACLPAGRKAAQANDESNEYNGRRGCALPTA